ncbi:MAG: hypothetical protein AAF383_09720 [Cyanobacteria bacterium P01_A01_bin.83]
MFLVLLSQVTIVVFFGVTIAILSWLFPTDSGQKDKSKVKHKKA